MFFIRMTGLEQECQLEDSVPTVEEYQLRRMGSGAVGVCLAITESALDENQPSTRLTRHQILLWYGDLTANNGD